MPPESLARVQRMLKAVSAEVERSVSPALAGELRHLVGCGGAEPGASEVRIEYASLLGWVGGLVIGMYGQLEDAKRDLYMAGHAPGKGPGGGDSRPGTGVVGAACRLGACLAWVGRGTGLVPDPAVEAFAERAAAGTPEQPPVCRAPESPQVPVQQAGKLRGDRDRPDGAFRAEFEAAGLAWGAVASPGTRRPG
jgi:hypothetical protein